ncbi:hypothetical protein [Streptomyces sp. NPDC002343]
MVFIAAAAGLLAGRPVTTHRDYLGRLAKLGPSVDVRRGPRFVDDGTVVASAGVLVARYDGPEAAESTRSGIQYEAPESDRRSGA